MKKNLSFNEDKQYLVLMLAGILNIIFYILYNKYTHFLLIISIFLGLLLY